MKKIFGVSNCGLDIVLHFVCVDDISDVLRFISESTSWSDSLSPASRHVLIVPRVKLILRGFRRSRDLAKGEQSVHTWIMDAFLMAIRLSDVLSFWNLKLLCLVHAPVIYRLLVSIHRPVLVAGLIEIILLELFKEYLCIFMVDLGIRLDLHLLRNFACNLTRHIRGGVL
jgi:hypothetical protein